MANPKRNVTNQKREITYEEKISESALNNLAVSTRAIRKPGKGRLQENRTIMKGRVSGSDYHSSLHIHISDNIEVENYSVEAIVKPSLTISIILEGHVEGKIGGQPFSFSASPSPVGYLWSIPENLPWSRDIKKNTHVRKVIITVAHDWLIDQLSDGNESDQVLYNFINSPMQIHEWALSKRVIALAEQLINPPQGSSFLTRLFMEGRALEIITKALEHTLGKEQTGPAEGGQNKAQQIRSHIEDNINSTLCLKTIAHDLGGSINGLQRQFKTAFGMTIMDYIRERRLIQAREAMEQDGITIAQAAYLAGYNSPANFSTAFKRAFGISPSDLKS